MADIQQGRGCSKLGFHNCGVSPKFDFRYERLKNKFG